MTGEGGARYRHGFDPDTSYGSAVRLIESAGLQPGLVLDLGCGYGAVAEPLVGLGHRYVGVDLDEQAVAELQERGHEAHRCDLLAPADELVERLSRIVDGRRLAAILALDVLEHLLDIPATLRALASVAEPSGAPLVVSFPNITHFDVGAKLLMGRWDTTDEGLLDRTHTQFLSGPDLPRVFLEAGWIQAGADDVIRPVSDQCFPSYTPALRPGTPAHGLLRAWRDAADPYGSTFQFVRLFRLHPPERREAVAGVDEVRPFATVIVLTGRGQDPRGLADLRRDLDDQHGVEHEVRVVEAEDGQVIEALNEALRQARGRYVSVLRPGQRVGPGWLAALVAAEQRAVGAVLRATVRTYDDEVGAASGEGSFAALAADAGELSVASLDPVHVDVPAPVIPAAFAVPAQVAQTAGVVPDERHGSSSLAVFLARAAALCGVEPAGGADVLVPRSHLPDPVVDGERIDDALSEQPMLLRAGDANRLADLRRRILADEARLSALEAQLASRDQQLELLAEHVRDLGTRMRTAEAERDLWRREAERRLGVRLRAVVRRVLERLASR
jgi:SAM-dependent methyltransferase